MKKHVIWDIGGDWSLVDMVDAMERHGMPQAVGPPATTLEIKRVFKGWASESGWISVSPIIRLGLLTRWGMPEDRSSFVLAHVLAREIGTQMGWDECQFQTKPRYRVWCRPEALRQAENIHSKLYGDYVERVDVLDHLGDRWDPVHELQLAYKKHIDTLKNRISLFGRAGYLVIDDPSRCAVCGSSYHRTAAVWIADVRDALDFVHADDSLLAGAVYAVCNECGQQAPVDIEHAAVENIKTDLLYALDGWDHVSLKEVVL